MKETTKRALLEFAKTVLNAFIAFLTATLVVSCGSTTKAIIKNGADSTTTTVSITTNNPTDWNVSPNTELQYKGKNIPDVE
ncbi:hypothetical protein [Capybara microvirus Cap3_SP_612]|nr:hypothetical protein [Capybara microvirus Cap3_SP_612]